VSNGLGNVRGIPPADPGKFLKSTDSGAIWAAVSGAGGMEYLGSYNPATTYNDGDYVIGPDGVTYVCVVDGTVGIAPSAWPAAPIIAYGTTLPGSPVDGLEAILVDSITNPSYQWRFRYNAGSSSAYKWEFIGGAAAFVYAGTGAWTTLSDTAAHWGPTMNAPRAGIYEGTMTAQVGGTTTGGWVSCAIRPADSGFDAVYVSVPIANGQFAGAVTARTAAVAAGAQIGGSFTASVAGMSWANAQLRLLPVRVS
jgi:hypothetical protein